MKLQAKVRIYLGRTGKAEPINAVKTEGSYIYDHRGRRYIDFYMGFNVGNLGWNNRLIARKLKEFDGPAYVAPNLIYRRWEKLAELLISNAPVNLDKVFRAATGTESVEMAIQAAMIHTGRTKFISIEGSYHGNSIAALSIGSSNNRQKVKNLLPGCIKISPPLDLKSALKINRLLGKKDIAAYISEPIITSVGVLKPDRIFFDIVARSCKKYGTLFIADEVATGFGHTGKMFACEHFDLKPDILCFAKAVTSGYAPLGGAMMTGKIAQSFRRTGFYSTYGWHPYSTEAAIISIEYLAKNRARIFKNADKLSGYFRTRLSKMPFKSEFKIGGEGLSIGLKLEKKRYADRIVKKALTSGLLITGSGSDSIAMFPALDMQYETAKEGLDILEACL